MQYNKIFTQKTINQITKKGGATFSTSGKMLAYKGGYQCSVQDMAVLPIERKKLITKEANKIASTHKGFSIGFWVDNGKMYIDISKHYNRKTEAIKQGLAYNQISIFDWKKQSCIYLKK